MIREQLVTVNAIRMPAETKSSKLEKGTNVANIVINTPANSAPFLGFPVESISPNIGGSKPSFAERVAVTESCECLERGLSDQC